MFVVLLCVFDGGLSSWVSSGSCGKTCGDGIQSFTRYIYFIDTKNYIIPLYTLAIINHYVVNGGWSAWRPAPCSKTCGGGLLSFVRACDRPEPLCGGKQCGGISVYFTRKKCNDFCCPGM